MPPITPVLLRPPTRAEMGALNSVTALVLRRLKYRRRGRLFAFGAGFGAASLLFGYVYRLPAPRFAARSMAKPSVPASGSIRNVPVLRKYRNTAICTLESARS